MEDITGQHDPIESVAYLDPAGLNVGDVILSTNIFSRKSWLIRKADGGNFSHAAIHVGGGFLVEAVPTGVQMVHCRRYQYGGEAVLVRRPKTASREVTEAAAKFAKQLVHRPYANFLKLVSSKLPVAWQDREALFCSELIAKSYPSLLKAPQHVTPKSLERHRGFDDVTKEAKRTVLFGALDSAMQAYERAVKGMLPPNQMKDPIYVEQEARDFAWTEMQRHDCFTEPYHLVDVYQQMCVHVSAHRRVVQSVDQRLADFLDQRGVDENGVGPRQMIPALTATYVDPQMMLAIVDVSSQQELEALSTLADDLVKGESWYLEELSKNREALAADAAETGLRSLQLAAGWIYCDEYYGKLNYDLLRQFANPYVVPTGEP